MSTSEQTRLPGSPATGPGGLPGGFIQPASEVGLLSPAELSRMANEMFNALPDELQQPATVAARVVLPANSAFSGNPFAALPGPTAPAVPGLLAAPVHSAS